MPLFLNQLFLLEMISTHSCTSRGISSTKTVGRDLRVKIHNSYIDHPRFEPAVSCWYAAQKTSRRHCRLHHVCDQAALQMLGFAFCTALAEGSQMQQRHRTKSAWGSTTGRTFKVEGKIRKRLVLFPVDYKSTANHYVGVLGSLTHEHTGLNCLAVIHRKPSERA